MREEREHESAGEAEGTDANGDRDKSAGVGGPREPPVRGAPAHPGVVSSNRPVSLSPSSRFLPF